MINRTLIRQKVVQLLYAYYQNADKDLVKAEEELVFSLSKAYDLYEYMLALMVAVSEHAKEQVERREETNRVMHVEENISHRFVDNLFVAQLAQDEQLKEYINGKKIRPWSNEPNFIKRLYEEIKQTDFYADYMAAESTDYAADRELWRKIYKNVIMKSEDLDAILEEQSLYWNDDRMVVDTFVLKTIKRFEQDAKESQLMPEYKDPTDKVFAVKLFRNAVLNCDEYREILSRCTRNWQFDRLAFMDVVIMQLAIAEMLNFTDIPTSVTINEYVEIAKWYSTSRSGSYINGTIDSAAKILREEGRIF